MPASFSCSLRSRIACDCGVGVAWGDGDAVEPGFGAVCAGAIAGSAIAVAIAAVSMAAFIVLSLQV